MRKIMKRKLSRKYTFPVVIEKDADGYFAFCPSLQGCHTQGETYEEALKNIEEAVQLHVEARLARRERIPASEQISLTTLEVEV
jgi:predicted RNase H-like HicB family nuclease